MAASNRLAAYLSATRHDRASAMASLSAHPRASGRRRAGACLAAEAVSAALPDRRRNPRKEDSGALVTTLTAAARVPLVNAAPPSIGDAARAGSGFPEVVLAAAELPR